MELREYVDIIRRRWWLPAGLMLLALVASATVSLSGSSAFRTDMRLAVSTQPAVDPKTSLYYDPIYYANLSSEYLADDLSEIIRSPAFAEDVSRELGYAISPTTIADITRTKKTHRLIDVTISTPTREEGIDIATAMERILNDRERLVGYLQTLEAYNGQVAIVNRPVAHRGSSTVGLVVEIALRTLVGLVLGTALAFLVAYLDQTLRTGRETERVLGLPILGEIPPVKPRRGVLA